MRARWDDPDEREMDAVANDALVRLTKKGGKGLFEIYCEEYEKVGIGVDPWSDMDEVDQEVWDAIATRLTDGWNRTRST